MTSSSFTYFLYIFCICFHLITFSYGFTQPSLKLNSQNIYKNKQISTNRQNDKINLKSNNFQIKNIISAIRETAEELEREPDEKSSSVSQLMQSIKKKDLVQSIATELDLPKAHILRVVNAVFDQISAALINGQKVNLSGFGSFETKYRQPRIGRNPQSGEILHLPGAYGPTFSYSKTLKDAVKSNLGQLEETEEEE